MPGFIPFTANAFVLEEDDVDTDIIFPARFLLHTERQGLGRFAFRDRPALLDAYARAGKPPILLAGANFGCGSSREHAVWSLHGMGVAAIFAPSFGEIFRGNCANNGIVAGGMAAGTLARLQAMANAGHALSIDLAGQTVTCAAQAFPFTVPDSDREMLLAGWNTTTRILALHGKDIAAFETSQRATAPWLWTEEADA
ncbi:3-isopropylmalate dehydratase small subunit 2 [Novosphingobium sp. HII-3]|uniref:3-isopropylmalate dehydratase small subunit n=1 Tax=Novosphingobium sp. HII-3 TaxID=2075565 RepID=UPI000CDA0073|nr:3-isopropylmalate dehydratase small subunit [Novosphingobium sp. HII-3]